MGLPRTHHGLRNTLFIATVLSCFVPLGQALAFDGSLLFMNGNQLLLHNVAVVRCIETGGNVHLMRVEHSEGTR